MRTTRGGWLARCSDDERATSSAVLRERTLLPDGRFVETRPDSLETEAEKKARPKYSSDAGRTIYGGGGITPDVIVPDDTLLTSEQQFLRAIAPKAQQFVTVLNQYALDLKKTATKDFTVTPAWRTELRRRLSEAGITIDQKYEPAATTVLDRELDRRVARLVLGDAGERQRSVSEDHQLARAVAMLTSARSQEALFALGHVTPSAATKASARPERR